MYCNCVILRAGRRWPYGWRGLSLDVTRRHSGSVRSRAAQSDKGEGGEGAGVSAASEEGEAARPQFKSSLIAAAFAPLKREREREAGNKNRSRTERTINEATTPRQLLDLVRTTHLTRGQALKVISILADWSTSGRADIKQLEKDDGFGALCRALVPRPKPPSPSTSAGGGGDGDDLSVVLNIKNDNDAAKIIKSFTCHQLVGVLSSLAVKRRRSVALLRTICAHISHSTTALDVKQGADVLYALATLNYTDPALMEKVSNDLCASLGRCDRSSVVGSVSTSLGMLRYRDARLLDTIARWVCANLETARDRDLSAVLSTLAHTDHSPECDDTLFEGVRRRLMGSPCQLDTVWALTVLRRAMHDDYASVLDTQFCNRLKLGHPRGLPTPAVAKLLNIDASARYSPAYSGPLLTDGDIVPTVLPPSRNKRILVSSVLEALSTLLPSSSYLRTDVDLKMGFSLDGECLLDDKMTPLALPPAGEAPAPGPGPASNGRKTVRIGVLVWDYHDYTKGTVGLCGQASLCRRLATAAGYTVLSVPYSHFHPRHRLTDRVKYLETNLKILVNQTAIK